jgi:hypothetical protein
MNPTVSTNRTDWLFLIALGVLIILLRLPSLEGPLDNDSVAVAYSARLITRGEPLYSTHHPGHHMPGTYYTYALAFRLFGDSGHSVKLLLIPWTIATAISLYYLGSTLGSKPAGIFSSLAFGVLSSHAGLLGTTAEPEMFALLPYTLTILLAVHQIQTKADWKSFFLTGVFGSIAFIYKAVFLAPMVVSFGLIFLDSWKENHTPGEIEFGIKRSLGLIAGFVATLSLVIAYFASIGLFDRFLMVFTFGRIYVDLTDHIPAYVVFFIPILTLAKNNLVITILGIVGTIRLVSDFFTSKKHATSYNLPVTGIMIWFILSILTAGITRMPFPHYTLITLPALSTIVGLEFANFYRIIHASSRSERRVGIFILTAIITVAVINSAITNSSLYTNFVKYKWGWISEETFIVNELADGRYYPRNVELATLIIQMTEPDDYVYHWTDFPMIYYTADLQAPIDMIWPTQAELSGSYKRIFSDHTKIIVVGSSLYLPVPEWMNEELEHSYELVTVIDEQRVYKRIEE